MKENQHLAQIAFILLVWLELIVSVGVTWVVGTFVVIKLLANVLPGISGSGGEGAFALGAVAVGLSPVIAGLGLIPAYFISMKLASFLREKYGWPLRHPRRLFLLALAIPVLLLIFFSAVRT